MSDWHLDKRVPIGLIFAILVQTGTMFWWASRVDSTLATHADRLEKQSAYMLRMESQISSMIELKADIRSLTDRMIWVQNDIRDLRDASRMDQKAVPPK